MFFLALYINLLFLEITCCREQVEEMGNFLFSYSHLKKNRIPNDISTLQNKSHPWARNVDVEFSSWRTMLTVLLEQHSDQSLFVIWFLFFLIASFPEMYFYDPEELISGMNDTVIVLREWCKTTLSFLFLEKELNKQVPKPTKTVMTQPWVSVIVGTGPYTVASPFSCNEICYT